MFENPISWDKKVFRSGVLLAFLTVICLSCSSEPNANPSSDHFRPCIQRSTAAVWSTLVNRQKPMGGLSFSKSDHKSDDLRFSRYLAADGDLGAFDLDGVVHLFHVANDYFTESAVVFALV